MLGYSIGYQLTTFFEQNICQLTHSVRLCDGFYLLLNIAPRTQQMLCKFKADIEGSMPEFLSDDYSKGDGLLAIYAG
jgi:hypothetical protein